MGWYLTTQTYEKITTSLQTDLWNAVLHSEQFWAPRELLVLLHGRSVSWMALAIELPSSSQALNGTSGKRALPKCFGAGKRRERKKIYVFQAITVFFQ